MITPKKAFFKEPLYLESGRTLEHYEIVYETYGSLNEQKNNVIVVCHALTGSANACGFHRGANKAGWWDGLIGDNKCIDTGEYFVICTNILGSCFGSTNPMSADKNGNTYRFNFPVITIKDMVKAQMLLLNRMGINRVEAVIGGSLGGMQVMHYCVDYAGFAKKAIVLASTYETKPLAIAFNKITQKAILKDPDFKGGYYSSANLKKSGLNGLSIGRMAGHISFLSHRSMESKFGRNYVSTDGLYELFGRFEVERYLDYNGGNFSKIFDPLSYLYIMKAMNIYDLSRGYDSLKDALTNIRSNLYLIGFSGDILFSVDELKHIYNKMLSINKFCKYYEVDSDYGHDAFLVEIDKFSDFVSDALRD